MKEIEKNESQAREKYEPMEIKVMKVTPQGVLCQSGGGGGLKGMLGSMSRTGGSW